jgi:multiple sugar transport system ATP-binding protein
MRDVADEAMTALVVATAPGRLVPKVGSTVSIQAGVGSIYLFDAATEKALGHRWT